MNVQVHTVQLRKQQMERGEDKIEGTWMSCNVGLKNPSSNLCRIIDKQTNSGKNMTFLIMENS